MWACTRLLSALTFLLSLGLIVNALPPAHRPDLISHRQYNTPEHYDGKSGYYESREHGPNVGDRTIPNIQGQVWTLKGRLDTKLALLGRSKDMDDAKAVVETIIEIIKEEQSRLANISANIPVEVHLKIAHVIIKVFIELVSVCVKLSLKFDAPLVANLLAEIDATFSGYLVALTDCVPDLIQVLNNLAININGEVISDIRVVGMTQCVKFLGLASRIPGAAR